jgi:hypothetical protein
VEKIMIVPILDVELLMQAKLGENHWRCSNMPCIVIVANIALNENNCLNQLVNHNDWPKW